MTYAPTQNRFLAAYTGTESRRRPGMLNDMTAEQVAAFIESLAMFHVEQENDQ